MKITYIHHSSFFVETEEMCMIFDYYKDDGIVKSTALKTNKPLYVFSSHSHNDHFSPEIFEWQNIKRDIKYILSEDVYEKTPAKVKSAVYLEKGGIYKDSLIYVKAYGSTDEGVSFYVETNEGSLFHAGDLNNWHWVEEADEEESLAYEEAYHKELDFISSEIKEIDAVMFPVDKRLGKDYYKGALEFITAVKTNLFIPMHFWNDYKSGTAFKRQALLKNCKFFEINRSGDFYEI